MNPNLLDPKKDTPESHIIDFIIPTLPVDRDSFHSQASQFLVDREVALRKISAYSRRWNGAYKEELLPCFTAIIRQEKYL